MRSSRIRIQIRAGTFPLSHSQDRCSSSSYFDPIVIDPTEYTIILLDGNKDSVEVIRAVNKVSHCNLLKSKQLIENAPCVIFSGDALEVHEMKEILDEEAVLYRIEPDYPYD